MDHNIDQTTINTSSISTKVEVQLALLVQEVKRLGDDIKDIKDLSKTDRTLYVTKDEFAPVKTLVYGMVGLILIAVVGAILALVLKR